MTGRELQVRAELRRELRPPTAFRPGDRVVLREADVGSLVSTLTTRVKREPGLEVDVVKVHSTWLTLVADDGEVYTGHGSLYFRAVGPCAPGDHYGVWKSLPHEPHHGTALPPYCGWCVCARCDQPLPEHVPESWLYPL